MWHNRFVGRAVWVNMGNGQEGWTREPHGRSGWPAVMDVDSIRKHHPAGDAIRIGAYIWYGSLRIIDISPDGEQVAVVPRGIYGRLLTHFSRLRAALAR